MRVQGRTQDSTNERVGEVGRRGSGLCAKVNVGTPIDPEEGCALCRDALQTDELDLHDRIILVHVARVLPADHREVAVQMLCRLWPQMRQNEDEANTISLLVWRLVATNDERVREIAVAMLNDQRGTVGSQAGRMFGTWFQND